MDLSKNPSMSVNFSEIFDFSLCLAVKVKNIFSMFERQCQDFITHVKKKNQRTLTDLGDLLKS